MNHLGKDQVVKQLTSTLGSEEKDTRFALLVMKEMIDNEQILNTAEQSQDVLVNIVAEYKSDMYSAKAALELMDALERKKRLDPVVHAQLGQNIGRDVESCRISLDGFYDELERLSGEGICRSCQDFSKSS